jgi:hypothetical protein
MVKEFKIFGKQVFQWGEPPEVTKSKAQRSMKKVVAFHGGDVPYKKLSFAQMRKIALCEPMIYKAIQKKNLDTVRNWFVLKSSDGSDKVSDKVLKIIKNFDKRVQFPYKLFTAGVSANIYGTGFLERTFVEPDGLSIESNINEKYMPLNLIPLNSESIGNKKPKSEKGDISYWVKGSGANEVFMHPNRIIDIATDRLPFSSFGISKIHILRNILNSKMEGDVAAGDTLGWASHGIVDTTITGMQDDQEREMLNLYKQQPSAYVHDEDYEINVHNPEAINPKPFYDYFYTNIAAVMIMPTHMLTGAELGNVTGSEVGFGAYVHDVENIQKVIYTPIIEKIYRQLLKSQKLEWKYDIVWNPIFVDELSEGKILQVRSYSAVNSKNAGIIDEVEARRILNNGVVDLDVNKVPEPKEPVVPVDQPNVEPQPPTKSPTVKQIKVYPLNEKQKEMIERAIVRERELGEEILREQEELYANKMAKKKINKRRNKK